MSHSKLLSFLLLFVFLFSAACTTQGASTPVVNAPTEAQTQPAALESTQPTTLTVLAAASLTEPFKEIGQLFETEHANTKVEFSFAGSQQLAQQLGQGAIADVFASASPKYMDAAVEAGRVTGDSAKIFIQNRLVVIYPSDNPAGLKTLSDLAKPGIKLDFAAKEVPVGQYTLDFLDKTLKDSSFDASYKDAVLNNVVSYEDNVKAVLTKVSLGEVDAGIVYSSDVTGEAASKVVKLDIPDTLNVIATYPIAAISGSKNVSQATAFMDMVLAPQGQAILTKYGFISITGQPAAQQPSGGSYTVTDALGREITFQHPPQRIVLTGKALFMVADAIYLFPEAGKSIAALGSTNQGTGNFIPMIDPAFADKITLASDAGPEQIAAAQPDCVILKTSNAEKLGKPLESLNIPVVYVDFETPDQYQRDLKTLGQLFQNESRAAQLATYFQDKTAAITNVVAAVPEDQKPRTLVLYYSNKDGATAFNVPPMAWMQALMVQLAGGTPAWQDANLGSGWTKVNFEQIAAWDPDTIFVIAYTGSTDEVVQQLKNDPQWQALRAVKNNQLYSYAKDVYSWDQPDPRWILGLTWMAGKLHPDLFPGQDITQTAQSFYQDLYGLDEATFQKNIQPVLTGDIH